MSNNQQIKKDPHCATCMMHSDFEAGITAETFTAPREFGSMASTFRQNDR